MPIPSVNPTPPAAPATSVIVYGPQGSGKSFHAAALARHFGLAKIEDDETAAVYHQLKTIGGAAAFKARGVLVLTSIAPPDELADERRILHIRDALRIANLSTRPAQRS